MFVLITIYLFLVGLAFGSFALAMVDRMHSGKDWVRGRSACDSCGHSLRPKDLIPLYSWLRAKGACAYCGEKLSISYPLTELSVAAAFGISFIFWPYELTGFIGIATFITWLIAVVLMTGLFLFDIRWFLLPNKLVYPLILTGFSWATLRVMEQGFSMSLVIDHALAVTVGAGIFLVLFVMSKGAWIGDGDVRFGVAIGLFTGLWSVAWLTLFTASVIGLIVALPLLIKAKKQGKKTKKRKKMQLKIPFGPMLILALFVTVLFGIQFVDWYSTNILLL